MWLLGSPRRSTTRLQPFDEDGHVGRLIRADRVQVARGPSGQCAGSGPVPVQGTSGLHVGATGRSSRAIRASPGHSGNAGASQPEICRGDKRNSSFALDHRSKPRALCELGDLRAAHPPHRGDDPRHGPMPACPAMGRAPSRETVEAARPRHRDRPQRLNTNQTPRDNRNGQRFGGGVGTSLGCRRAPRSTCSPD
jgi:hypothetical protein